MSNPETSGLLPEQKRQLLAKLLQQKAAKQRNPLSFAQKRLWFLEQLQPGLSVYNIPTALRLTGKLNISALGQSLQAIINRHEILRTSFPVVDGEPIQRIAASFSLTLPVVDLQSLPQEIQAIQMIQQATALAMYPFELAQIPLLRAVLLHLGDEEYVLLFVMHHIIADYWSLRVLVRELVLVYQGQTLPQLPIQYVDFANWQQKWLRSEARTVQLEYWQQQLQDCPRELSLSTDYPRPAVQTFRGARQYFTLSRKLSHQLGELGKQQGATLFMTLLAAFNVLLYRYSGQKDILVGSTVTSRDKREISNLIGLFVNNLVFRTKISENPSFWELLNQVKETTLFALAHQELPFEDLVEQLQPQRNLSQNPLFQVMFILHNTPDQSTQIPGLVIEPLETEHSTTRFDLGLDMYETPSGLRGTLEYSTDLFEVATIERFIEHFQRLLEGIVENPKQSIALLPILTPSEKQQILKWNDTTVEIPNLCVHELFAQQVEKTPDKTAVIFQEQFLTYSELNTQVNQLACYLQQLGIRAETRIGILCDRNAFMVVAMLGVLKASCTYVPLDPAYPQERLSFIIQDAQVSVILTQTKILDLLPENTAEVICVDQLGENLKKDAIYSFFTEVYPEQLAYLIYTSGSTGTPKGVQILHKSLTNFLMAMAEKPRLTSEDTLLAVTTLAFDIAALEIFLPLIVGASLVLGERETTLDGVQLAAVMEQQQITIMQATPATWRLLLASGWSGKADLKVLCGGEALDNTLALQLLSTSREVWNLYGPTETTIWSAAKKLEINQPVTIGCPIANTQFYVLDEYLQPTPVGVAGELYIGGAGVARGYWGKPDLTAERFLPNPNHVETRYIASLQNRVYKTGDRVRYLTNGNLEYLGRLDYQVKIRGYRIELGEIEAVLMQQKEVVQAVVIVREDIPGEQRLVGYVVLTSTTAAENLRSFLMTKLPGYMIPGVFVVLEKLPLTPNGKVDRKALPAVDGTALTSGVLNTRTPTEELLAGIWTALLGVSVDVEDNFFDLGGHSLLATRVVSQIRQVFGVELPLRQLFEMPKLADLARVIEEMVQQTQGQVIAPAIVSIPRTENLPLSFAQQRFWVLTQLKPDSPFYNIPLAVQIQGYINIQILQECFHEIVRQQEILRTSFQTVDGQAVLRIDDGINVNISVIDLEGLADAEQQKQVEHLALEDSQQTFNLEESLLRVQLLRLNNTNHVFLLTLHHIIADAWSMGLLVKDMVALYGELSHAFALRLAEKAQRRKEEASVKIPRIQYADYAWWQREWLQGEVLGQHLEYWQQQLADAPALLELPTDYPRPAVQSFRGNVYRFDLSGELTQEVKKLSQRHHSTLFMTLLASLNVLLHRYTGSDDIVVGSPIANRNRTETETLIGCFANTLALRTDLSGNPSFEILLERVRNASLGAYVHQELPFEQLVEALQPTRSLSYSPIFQVMLVLQNLPVTELEMEGVKWQVMESDSKTAKFDLTWTVSESNDGLSCRIEYSSDLFELETIARLVENLETLLQGIIENPQQKIGELPLLSGNEQELLTSWNQTQREYSKEKCLHELFQEQVDKTPTHTAIVWGRENLSYQELNHKANQLAHYLRQLGVKPEVTVGICTDRSLDLVIGLLGILKAGGVYVPLDPNYPAERLALIAEDAQIKVVVSQQQQLTNLPKLNIPVVCLDTLNPDVETRNFASLQFASLENCVSPDNLAYIIYTSGTTGIPKGVAIPHRNGVTLMHWAKEVYTPAQLSSVLASTSISFDLSVFEIFVPLSWGGTIILAENALQLPELPAKEQVTLLNTVPTAARELLKMGGIPASVQTVNLAGEALPQTVVRQLYQQSTINQVINLYGPSEDTTYSTIALIPQHSQHVTIGRPIANTEVYILDENLQRVPIGVPGELYLSGAGVARGYWQKPNLTAEKFLPNPVQSLHQNIVYKTGDRARYLADGNIEYLGRIDQQVKLRGFRIELGEIEAILNQHPAITQSVAIVRQDDTNDESQRDRIIAYIIPKPNLPTLQESEIRSFLAEKLPSYMIPSLFVILSALPLTANGKIDRRALPNPQWQPSTSIAPRTPIEQKLATIWSQVLAVESVGIADNFFSLGGDSILAIQVVAKANQQGLGLQLRQIFQYQTVGELAAVIDGNAVSASQEMVTGDIPLTPIQHWFFEQNLVDSHHWNQAIILSAKQPLNFTWLQQAWEKLILHHDQLRARFEKTKVGWQQINSDRNLKLPLIYLDMATLPPEAVSNAITQCANDLQGSFDLAQSPLLRVAYFHLGEGESVGETGRRHRILLVFHHLIIDGISWRIILEDLQLAYHQLSQGEAIQLPPKTTSFQQWAIQLQKYANSNLQQSLSYWTSQNWQQVTPIPVDSPGSNTMADVETFSISLSPQDTQALLQEVSSTYQTQINDILLTALALAFSDWTGNSTLLIELEGHGREDLFPNMNFSRTVGWFTSLFPLLLDVSASSDLAVSLKTIKEQIRQVPNGISYGLLRYLAPKEVQTLELIPNSQVRFNYLGQSDQIFAQSSTFQPGEESAGYSRSPKGDRNTLIEINSIVKKGQIRFDWTYSRKLHQHQTITILAENYLTKLRSLIQHCLSPDAFGFTPSDFPQMQLSQDELDDLLADL